jgi:hypothetical protein
MSIAVRRPWYREPWLWFIVAIPATTAVLGVVMTIVAFLTYDGLVADDYYKQGLAINQTIDREQRARALGLRASLAVERDGTAQLELRGEAAPEMAVVRLLHPTRAGADRVGALAHRGGGVYTGTLRVPSAGRWRIVIEDDAGTWRLTGTWDAERRTAVLEGE